MQKKSLRDREAIFWLKLVLFFKIKFKKFQVFSILGLLVLIFVFFEIISIKELFKQSNSNLKIVFWSIMSLSFLYFIFFYLKHLFYLIFPNKIRAYHSDVVELEGQLKKLGKKEVELIYINPKYKQKDILKFFNTMKKMYQLKVDSELFISNFTTYKNELPESYYLMKEIRNKDLQDLNEYEGKDFISFIKYLKQKDVLMKKINSNRKLARIIENYLNGKPFKEEAIRKQLSKLNIPIEIQRDLNYHLK